MKKTKVTFHVAHVSGGYMLSSAKLPETITTQAGKQQFAEDMMQKAAEKLNVFVEDLYVVETGDLGIVRQKYCGDSL